MTGSKHKTVVFNTLLYVVLIGIGLLGSEFVLQLKNKDMKNYDIEMWKYSKALKQKSADPILGHEHIPSKKAILQSTEIRLNERGMRGDAIPPQTNEKRRILVLGSSITLGWGVPEAQTMTARLEKKFKAAGQDVDVLNAGIGNYNTQREVRLFMTKLKEVEPTDIVVHYFLRDAEQLDAGGGNWLLQNSQLAVTLWVVYNRIVGQLQPKSLTQHYTQVYDPQSPGYQEMKTSLKRLSDYAKAHNIRIYMAMTPDVHNLKQYPFTGIHQTMSRIAQELGYQYVDLLPGFKGLTPEKIWAMPGDPHPNALGHKIMADTLFPLLQLKENHS